MCNIWALRDTEACLHWHFFLLELNVSIVYVLIGILDICVAEHGFTVKPTI